MPYLLLLPAAVCAVAAAAVASEIAFQTKHGWRWHHLLPVATCGVAVAGAVVAAWGVVA